MNNESPLGKPCPKRDGPHCVHSHTWTHTVEHHRDEYCCYCGESFCYYYTLPDLTVRPKRHGPHYDEPRLWNIT